MVLNSSANEHLPKHVHVLYGGGWAKIELGSLRVIYSTLKAHELAECLAIAAEHNAKFEEKWHEWFSRR